MGWESGWFFFIANGLNQEFFLTKGTAFWFESQCSGVSSLSCAFQAKEPKAIMKIEHLNATFQPAKIGNPHGLQITYLKDNSTRNIFVYHEDGKVRAWR